MDFDEIKNLIEIDGGKFIIVENGKPTVVVASFDEYKKKLMQPSFVPSTSLRALAGKEKKPIPKELETDELKLEDLPLT